MPGHTSGAQQPLLHGGTHHSPYGGLGHHHHHNHHNHHIHPGHHHHHHPHHPHHDFHYGHRRHWYHPWISFNSHPAPIVQPPFPHTDVIVVDRPRFRFLNAVIYTIIIWLLLGALVRSLTTDWVWGYKYERGSPRQWAVALGNASLDYPVPSGVGLTSCENPLEDGGSNGATLQVPSSSDAILLFADGPWLYGTVQITTAPAETGSVKFIVNLSSRHERSADTIVCSVKRGEGEEGVGIFNPRGERRDPDDPIRYDVVVEFPENHPVVKRFESDVINSVHNIGDLQGKILFEALSLHGSNGGIYSKSLSAQFADITTVNGPIDGYYNASDFLKIHTVNGRIEVDIDFNQDTSDKAVLSLFTSNSPIKANLRLHDFAASRSAPANFDVTAETANSPLNIAFLDAPVDSTLSLQASTAVSPAEVTLHPTFEGHFSLSSTLFSPVIQRGYGVGDPSGRGRRRFVSYRSVRGHVDGDVTWGEGPKENQGKVDISSSIARVTLNL